MHKGLRDCRYVTVLQSYATNISLSVCLSLSLVLFVQSKGIAANPLNLKHPPYKIQ